MTSSLERFDYEQQLKRRRRRLRVPLDMPLKQFERSLEHIRRFHGEPELEWPVRAGRETPTPVPNGQDNYLKATEKIT